MSTEVLQADKVMDARNAFCPGPLMELIKSIKKGEVGKVGVAIDTLRDMEILFEDIPLSKLKRVSMLGNSFGPIALSLFIALGEKQGLKPEQLTGTVQNDILKEYVARGTYIFPPKPSLRLVADVIEYLTRRGNGDI